ncbi:thioredoxin family protein [Desulfotignum balticum]|uniref:thioredoxin family protein n=1 Tax=Desulfotignum balticum TaxID=115781 RepID=UPI00041FF2C0|nr:thioredoxin family protein [Desulfotignum balticum]
MTPSETRKITDWAASQAQQPHTLYLSDSSHPEQPAFDAFASELTRIAPCIRILPSDRPCRIPGFFIADNICFSALPLEKELAPFLEALSYQAHPPTLPDNVQAQLAQVSHSCHLTLFIAVPCPHCPDMVRSLIPLAIHSTNVFLEIIDGSLFPETAREHQVMSVPCLILDQDFRWTGHADLKEILTQAIERDPSRLSAATFRQILEQGDADWICRQMIQADTLFKGFMDLLLHPEWSVRLGAMVVVESLAEEAPPLAARLCPVLVQAFEDQTVSVQGDILYALGEAGDQTTRAWIEHIMPDLTHPDLMDAAKDALAAIQDRV